MGWREDLQKEEQEERRRECTRILKTPKLLHQIYESCGIAQEFWTASASDFPSSAVKNAIGTLQKGKRKSLYLFGSPGRGKTHFSSVICKHFAEQDIRAAPSEVKFLSLADILLQIRSGFDNKKSEEGILNEYIYYKFLVLDDIGITRSSQFSRETLFYISDYRWKWNKPTIYITDRTYSQMLGELFSEKIMSRIYHNRIHFRGGDRRQTDTKIIEIGG